LVHTDAIVLSTRRSSPTVYAKRLKKYASSSLDCGGKIELPGLAVLTPFGGTIPAADATLASGKVPAPYRPINDGGVREGDGDGMDDGPVIGAVGPNQPLFTPRTPGTPRAPLLAAKPIEPKLIPLRSMLGEKLVLIIGCGAEADSCALGDRKPGPKAVRPRPPPRR
jgi:hypothetical protein